MEESKKSVPEKKLGPQYYELHPDAVVVAHFLPPKCRTCAD
jgi:hypothetical protein